MLYLKLPSLIFLFINRGTILENSTELGAEVERTMKRSSFALNRFYATRITALSCREVSLLTLSSLDEASVRQLLRELDSNRKRQRGETLSYFILKSIAELAPLQTIRTVYSELLLQFFWAYALRGMEGSQEYINRIYAPYFDALAETLQKEDYSRFSAALEELIIYELRSTVDYLSQLDFPEMENILIPDENRN